MPASIPPLAIAPVHSFLNGPAFLGFVRDLTGVEAALCDAHATRYTAGHFLAAHDDAVDGKNRLLAYVLNFTPAWRADWGGLLLLHDAVSQVASFVTESRLAITGWVRRR